MAGNKIIGGIIEVRIDGAPVQAKGDFKYAPSFTKKTSVIGSDGTSGFSTQHSIGYIEGEITDHKDMELSGITEIVDATVTLGLANGKMFILRGAAYTGDGSVSTGEGNIAVRFEGDGEEVLP